MTKNLFIEIEAPEFGGKTTLCNNLKKLITDIPIDFIRLPGFSSLGEKIRHLIKYEKMGPKASLGLAFAAHMDAYDNMSPLKNYVVDRALTSCVVYQGYIQGLIKSDKILFDHFYDNLSSYVNSKFKRLVFYIDIDVDEIFRRKALANRVSEVDGKTDVFDEMNRDEMEFLIKAYKETLLNPIYNPKTTTFIIDGKQSPEQIALQVINKIKEAYGK